MVYKNRTRQVLLYVIGTLLLSSCDYRIWGSINNKTDSDARIMCYLVDLKSATIIQYTIKGRFMSR